MSWVLGILLILVFVFAHETGHFVVGRAVGVRFTEYSIGMGPRLVGWERGGVDYRLSLLPIGGYVRQDLVDGRPCFESLAKWRALLFIFAGVATNFALAFLSIFALYWIYVGTTLGHAFGQTVSDFWSLTLAIPSVMWDLIVHPINNSGVTHPGQTVSMASHAVSGFHWERIAYFSALINVGLAVVNALPVMPLDGGQAVHIMLRSERGWVARSRQVFLILGVGWFVVFVLSNVLIPLYRLLQDWLVGKSLPHWLLPATLIVLAILSVGVFLLNRSTNQAIKSHHRELKSKYP